MAEVLPFLDDMAALLRRLRRWCALCRASSHHRRSPRAGCGQHSGALSPRGGRSPDLNARFLSDAGAALLSSASAISVRPGRRSAARPGIGPCAAGAGAAARVRWRSRKRRSVWPRRAWSWRNELSKLE